jgi:hypothetical protein
MPALTPTLVRNENAGTERKVLARFASVDDGDTWASNIKGITHVVPVDKTGTTTAGVAASFSGTTITFKTGTNGKAVDLLVYARG